MKYMKHPVSKEVYAYEEDGSQDEYIRPGLQLMTEEEVIEHLQRPLKTVRVPFSVSAFQARAVLLKEGLLDDVLLLMEDPSTPREIMLAWEYATEFRRDSPTVAAIADIIGLTSEQLDKLFIDASLISA